MLQFGFGMEISAEQLANINAERNGRLYYDEAAAKDVHGHARKQPLTESPEEKGKEKENTITI